MTTPIPPNRGVRGRFRRNLAVVLVAVVAFAVVTAVVSVLGNSRLGNRSAMPPSTSPTTTGPPTGGHSAHGGAAPAPPLDPAARPALLAELEVAADAVPGPTVADALAAGYQVSNTLEGPGDVHLLDPDRYVPTFDPSAPSELLATSREPDGRVIAAVYLIPSDAPTPPAGFSGDADQWHHHEGTSCQGASGDTPTDAASCAGAGGTWIPYSAWMLHVWVVPGFGNAEGVFTADNPCIAAGRCPDASPLPG